MHAASFDFDVVTGPSTPPKPRQAPAQTEPPKPPAAGEAAPPAPPPG
ncbi:MAG TPA: hypothetical protein VN702_13500 [Acetobacteraceae bacterium]|nr:hypothetical protein [Acetobacteraceae bacterium]